MVLTSSGKVFATGEGESGMLGTGGTSSSADFSEIEFFANGGAQHESVLNPIGSSDGQYINKSTSDIKTEAEQLD